jgi:hypothetical protein
MFTTLPDILAEPLNKSLGDAGFKWKKGRMAYRITSRKIDVLTVERLGPGLCDRWNVPAGTATIGAACYLPFVPSLELAEYHCGRSPAFIPKSHLDCQIHLAVRRRVKQRALKPENLWLLDEYAKSLEAPVNDMLNVIENEVFPFFSYVEDIRQFLGYLQTGENNMGGVGIWNIGRIPSFYRFYLTGFTALEAEEWPISEEAFINCRKIALELEMDISADVMACIEKAEGLAAAHMKLS